MGSWDAIEQWKAAGRSLHTWSVMSNVKKSGDIPVTTEMLHRVRDQIQERIDKRFFEAKADQHKVRADFQGLRTEFHGLKTEFQGLRAEYQGLKTEFQGLRAEYQGLKTEFQGLRADFQGLKSEVHGLKEELHRVAILVEDQNARNRYVLDGLMLVLDRQDRMEKQLNSSR